MPEMKQRLKSKKHKWLTSGLMARILSLCDGEYDKIAIMATVACELFNSVDDFNWVGFYRVVGSDLLKIGPYQGQHGCLVIPFNRGVCGAAASLREIKIIDDVEKFDGHIACSSSTKSELVIPCFDWDGRLFAVLDIDSDKPAFFSEEDASNLDCLMRKLFMKNKVLMTK